MKNNCIITVKVAGMIKNNYISTVKVAGAGSDLRSNAHGYYVSLFELFFCFLKFSLLQMNALDTCSQTVV